MNEGSKEKIEEEGPDTMELDQEIDSLEKEEQGEFVPESGGGEFVEMPGASEQLAGVFSMVISAGSEILGGRLGEQYKLFDQEIAQLSNAYAQAVDYYFPDAEVGPGVTALLVTGMVVGPRYAMYQSEKAAKQKQSQQQEGEKDASES